MVIRAQNIWKKFGRFEALQGLSFNVPQGSAYALVGANGAGKTTTIKLAMNIIEPSRGSIEILGVDSRKMSARELAQIGYVSENQDMPERLTVQEFLDYLRPFYSNWDCDLENSIRAQLRLPSNRRIRDLSHGMRIKMALACALPFRPKLLVLDEPFSGLDPLVRDEFMEGLLNQAGDTTILISSHELTELNGVATHIAFIDQGKLLFEESMSDLSARFREVHVALDGEPVPHNGVPREWLHLRSEGSVLSFVETQYSEEDLGEKVHAALGEVRRIDAQPMELRAIFTTLAREARNRAEELAGASR